MTPYLVLGLLDDLEGAGLDVELGTNSSHGRRSGHPVQHPQAGLQEDIIVVRMVDGENQEQASVAGYGFERVANLSGHVNDDSIMPNSTVQPMRFVLASFLSGSI